MPKWEYQYLGVDFKTEQVRLVNGQELPNWKRGLHVSGYLNQAGNEGWEVVGIMSPNAPISPVLVIKRPKP
jgi:hypothetical protein